MLIMVYTVLLSVYADNIISSALEIYRLVPDGSVLVAFMLYAGLWLGLSLVLLYTTLVYCTHSNWDTYAEYSVDNEPALNMPVLTLDEVLRLTFEQ